MIIFSIQKQKIWYETLVDYLHATGTIPSQIHVRQRIASTLTEGPGSPTFQPPSFYQWNPFDISMTYERMLWDLDVYMRAVDGIDNSILTVLERSVQALAKQQERLQKKMKALSSRLQTQTRWTFYDTFDSMKMIDLNNTSALVDTVAGNVSLPVKIDMSVSSRVLVERTDSEPNGSYVHTLELETDGSDAIEVLVKNPSSVEIYLFDTSWTLAATADVTAQRRIYHGPGNQVRVVARSLHGPPGLVVHPLRRRYIEMASVQSKPFAMEKVPGYPTSTTYINIDVSAQMPASTEVRKELLLFYSDDPSSETPVSVNVPYGLGRTTAQQEVSSYSRTNDGVYRLNTLSLNGTAPYSSVYAGADGYLVYARQYMVGPGDLTTSQLVGEMRSAPPAPHTFDVEQMYGFCRPSDLSVVRKYTPSTRSYYYQPNRVPEGEDVTATFIYRMNVKLPSDEVVPLHGLLIGGNGIAYEGISRTLPCLEPGWVVRYSSALYTETEVSTTFSLIVVSPNGTNPIDVGLWINGTPQVAIFGSQVSFAHRKVGSYLHAGWNQLDIVIYVDYLSLKLQTVLGTAGGALVGWSIPSGLTMRAVPDKLRRVNPLGLRTSLPAGRMGVWAPSPDSNYIEIARPYPSRSIGSLQTQPMPYQVVTRTTAGTVPKQVAYRLTLLTRDPNVSPVVQDCKIEVYDIE